MDIFRLTTQYCKLAQLVGENTELAGSLQKLTDEVTTLHEEITAALEARVVEQQAMTDADAIERMTADLLVDFKVPAPDWNAMVILHRDLVNAVKDFDNAYREALLRWVEQRSVAHGQPIPARYSPISKIQETLTVVDALLQQQANQLPPPPTEA
jgi:hypothetical protein